jgi:hypothetical protein
MMDDSPVGPTTLGDEPLPVHRVVRLALVAYLLPLLLLVLAVGLVGVLSQRIGGTLARSGSGRPGVEAGRPKAPMVTGLARE